MFAAVARYCATTTCDLSGAAYLAHASVALSALEVATSAQALLVALATAADFYARQALPCFEVTVLFGCTVCVALATD
jgi:hypothetical protein